MGGEFNKTNVKILIIFYYLGIAIIVSFYSKIFIKILIIMV